MPLGRPSYLGHSGSTLADPEVLFGREGQFGSENRRFVEVLSPEKDLARPGQESEERWKPDFPRVLGFVLIHLWTCKVTNIFEITQWIQQQRLASHCLTRVLRKSRSRIDRWDFKVIELLLAMLSCVVFGYQRKIRRLVQGQKH
jgi:hypothetical protein